MRLMWLLKRYWAKELSKWVQDNLITQYQAEQICERYGIDYKIPSSSSYGYTLLVRLGYLFIGLAILIFIQGNWDDIPRGLRISGLFLLTFNTYLLALKKYKEGHISFSENLFFLGSLFYGTSIMLIAQIYYLGEHYPDGVFWWAVGIAPLALLLRSSLIMGLLMILSFIWFMLEARLDYIPMLYPVFLAILGWHVFGVKYNYILFLGFMVGLYYWIDFQIEYIVNTHTYFKNMTPVNFFGTLISFFSFSNWLLSLKKREMNDYGTILNVVIRCLSVLALLWLSISDISRYLLRIAWHNNPIFVVITAFLFSIIAFGFNAKADKQNRLIISGIIIVYLSMVSMVVWLADLNNDHYELYFQIAANILLIVIAVWWIIKGVRENISHCFFLGILSILLLGLFRYSDLIGDSYLATSILFILYAVIILLSARFWRDHKHSQHRV